MRFQLVQPDSAASTQVKAASTSEPTTATVSAPDPVITSEPDTTPAPAPSLPEKVEVTGQREAKRTEPAPEQPATAAVASPPASATKPISRNSAPAAQATPTTARSTDRPQQDNLTQLTQQPEDQDPYTLQLMQKIMVALDQQRGVALSSLPRPVAVELELYLLPSGALTRAVIIQSSGLPGIDQAAYRATLAASPYPAPPREGRTTKSFRIELWFSPERM